MPSVLVADDSLFQRHMVGKIAREMGFTVYEAKTGEECLQLALNTSLAVIVLDLNMPLKNGFEVLLELKNAACPCPVIVLTADIQTTSRQRCLDLGVVDFLNKPIVEDQLRSLLRAFCA